MDNELSPADIKERLDGLERMIESKDMIYRWLLPIPGRQQPKKKWQGKDDYF